MRDLYNKTINSFCVSGVFYFLVKTNVEKASCEVNRDTREHSAGGEVKKSVRKCVLGRYATAYLDLSVV